MSHTYDYEKVTAANKWLEKDLENVLRTSIVMLHAGKMHCGVSAESLKERLVLDSKLMVATSWVDDYGAIKESLIDAIKYFSFEIAFFMIYGKDGDTIDIACKNDLPAIGYMKDEAGKIREIPSSDLQYIVIGLTKASGHRIPVVRTIYPCTEEVARRKDPAM